MDHFPPHSSMRGVPRGRGRRQNQLREHRNTVGFGVQAQPWMRGQGIRVLLLGLCRERDAGRAAAALRWGVPASAMGQAVVTPGVGAERSPL